MATLLTVVFADTFRTRIAIQHEGESFPFRFRTVQVALTPGQEAVLAPQEVGESGGRPVFEERYRSWLEGTVAPETTETREAACLCGARWIAQAPNGACRCGPCLVEEWQSTAGLDWSRVIWRA